MNETTLPVQSLKSLLLATLFASILAIIILILAVLPAEYGLDPTGFGKAMGLTVLSAPAQEAVKAEVISCNEPISEWKDTVKITVPANGELEYKFHLKKNALLDFKWSTDGAKLYFDFHGEPKGDKTGYFKSFKVSTDNLSEGALTAPFEGSHGWYWKNETRLPVHIVLNTKGEYQVLGLM